MLGSNSLKEIRLTPRAGFEVSSLPVEGARFVHLTFTVRKGMECERSGEFGYFSLLGTLLGRGCGGLDRAEFARACDSRGAHVNIYPGRDYLTLEFWILPHDLDWAIRTLVDMIWEPGLRPSEVELAAREHLLQLQARCDEKRACLYDASRRALFGAEHHYGRPLMGTEEALSNVTTDGLREFHQRVLEELSGVLCVTGGFLHSQLESLLSQFLSTRRFVCSQRGHQTAEFQHQRRQSLAVPFPVEQADVLIALPAMARSDADYRLGLFCNEILGGAFLSRLTRAVRMKEGLAYSADSRYRAALEAGVIWIGLQTDLQNVRRALATVRSVIVDLRDRGLSREEFAHFKEFVGCSMPFDYDALSSLTSRRLENILFGEPWHFSERRRQFLEKVDLETTQSLFQQLLLPDLALVTVLGESVTEELGASFHEENPPAVETPPLEVRPGPKASTLPASGASRLVHSSNQCELRVFPNGMHVLMLPRRDVASVSLQLWTLTGSMDEQRGKTGLSHLLEHLMFRGTEDFPDGSFDAILAQRGGLNNAFTTEDFTVYTDYLVPEGLEEALGLEADRIQNLALTEEIFRTELSVVLEERSVRVTSSPLGTAYEKLQQLALSDHGYGHPIIGWREDLESMNLSDIQEHYRLATRPERLLLVAAGGIESESFLQLVERTFPLSGEPSEPIWPVLAAPRPVQPLKSANLRLERRSGYSYLLLCYRFPREGHPDYEACELLARIIGDGDSSRVYEKFVIQEQSFLEVWTNFESQARDNPLFHIGLASTEQFDHGKKSRELISFLESLHQSLSEEELKKARCSWLAEDAYLTDELEDWATEIAGRVMLMPWDQVWSDADRIGTVSLNDLKRVAQQYLSSEGAVYVTLQGVSEAGTEEG